MINFAAGQPQIPIDAYLDGLMAENERLEFERTLEHDPLLQDEVGRQRAIDAALGRALAVPDERLLAAIAQTAIAQAPRTRRVGRFQAHRILAMAASIALLVAGSWMIWRFAASSGEGRGASEQIAMTAAYDDLVSRGFEPEIVCADEAEFAAWFRYRFGQGLRLAALPASGEALGLAYGHVISPWTIILLCEVDDEEIVVFVDDLENDVGPTDAGDAGLHLHRMVVGRLVTYELSPFAKPRVLPSLLDPDAVSPANDVAPTPPDAQETKP